MSDVPVPESLSGLAASPGLAVGRVCFWSDPEGIPRYAITSGQVKEELRRLDEALGLSHRQLADLRQRVAKELGEEEAAIFSSHRLLLDDPAFYARVEKRLITENINLEAAVEDVVEEMMRLFKKIPDPYLRERADDYRDVGRRVLDNLLSYQRQCALNEGELIVLVARELMPSDTVHFQREHIGAFITERGGVASHAAILARSLRIPAVVSLSAALQKLHSGDLVVVNGKEGQVVLRPDPELIARARADQAARARSLGTLSLARAATTRDGVQVQLSANLTREVEAEEARQVGALGVGLLRTEFLFMSRGEFLDEEAQYRAYRHVIEIMAPHPVTIRTLDLGEDKQLNFGAPVESGTCVLGWRSLRLSLADRDVFLAQVKAVLRAAVHGAARILIPMVSGVEEIRQVRELIAEAEAVLSAQGIPFQMRVPLGAMIETPASALIPEFILKEVEFLSIGTNDLVQYTMVADRVSERMQPYYRSSAPPVLFLLQRLAAAAAAAGKDVSICGEIAGDPLYLPLLLGLGYRNLSVAPVLLPDLAAAIGTITVSQAEEVARHCLRLATADEIEAYLRDQHPLPDESPKTPSQA